MTGNAHHFGGLHPGFDHSCDGGMAEVMNSLSIKFGLIAAQLTATKGFPLWLLALCMPRATSSFPVPGSPVMRTLRSRLAAIRIFFLTSLISSDSPMRSSIIQQFSVRKSFNLKTIVGSHASVQSFHRLKNDGIEEIAQRGPELGLGPQSFPQEAEEPTAPLLDLVYGKG
jgi:hypothetical protein